MRTTESWVVGDIEAKPGCRAEGYLDVPGTRYRLPVTLLNGAETGKTVLITGGTHGAEFLGVETAIRLARELDPSKMSGRVALVHPANVPQFFSKTAYVGPDDGKNLNRVYPGKAEGTVSERIAYAISSNLLRNTDFYMDLHSGDIHETMRPYVIHSTLGSEETNRISTEASALWGAKHCVQSSGATGALGWAASQNIPGCLPEIGEGARWSEDEVAFFKAGAKNVLSYLGVIQDPITDMGEAFGDMGGVSAKDSVDLPPMDVFMCEEEGCWYPAFKPCDPVRKGEYVGKICDFFGNTIREFTAPKDGVVLFQASSLSICQGHPVIGIG